LPRLSLISRATQNPRSTRGPKQTRIVDQRSPAREPAGRRETARPPAACLP
jgi:hypothetical protein